MEPERKSKRLNARVPEGLVNRLDFVVRNTEGDDTRNRSAAVCTALAWWLAAKESELETRGVLPKKARP